jgi:hypothetical protein
MCVRSTGPCRRGGCLTTFAGVRPSAPRVRGDVEQTAGAPPTAVSAASLERRLHGSKRAGRERYDWPPEPVLAPISHLHDPLPAPRFNPIADPWNRAASRLETNGSLPRGDQPDDVCLTIQICANRATRASDRQPDTDRCDVYG